MRWSRAAIAITLGAVALAGVFYAGGRAAAAETPGMAGLMSGMHARMHGQMGAMHGRMHGQMGAMHGQMAPQMAAMHQEAVAAVAAKLGLTAAQVEEAMQTGEPAERLAAIHAEMQAMHGNLCSAEEMAAHHARMHGTKESGQ